MLPVTVDLIQRIRRRAPFSGGGLSRQDEPGHPYASQFLQLRGHKLTPTSLRIERMLHFVLELADRHRLLAVLLPPDRQLVEERLPAPITLLGFNHARSGILTAERK
jgi:hypothetical protein